MSDACFGSLLCWKTRLDDLMLRRRQHLYSQKLQCHHLWSKNILPVSISFLQVIISVRRSGLMVSLLHGWSPVECFMVCRLTVYSCARFWWCSSLGRRFSTWLNHVVLLQLFWGLQTHFSLVSLQSLWHLSLPLPGLYSVLGTLVPCVNFIYPSPALWASIILFLKSKLIPFVFGTTKWQLSFTSVFVLCVN